MYGKWTITRRHEPVGGGDGHHGGTLLLLAGVLLSEDQGDDTVSGGGHHANDGLVDGILGVGGEAWLTGENKGQLRTLFVLSFLFCFVYFVYILTLFLKSQPVTLYPTVPA